MRVFSRTIPDEISPYSTDGTPVMTSTDSMLVEAMLRVLAPSKSPSEALVERRTPSTSTAVPNDALPTVEPPSRSENRVSFIKSGLTVLPPGSRAEISDALTIWRWSMALPPTVREVAMASGTSRAVTTTFSSVRLSSGR